jgi:hypothetical protein
MDPPEFHNVYNVYRYKQLYLANIVDAACTCCRCANGQVQHKVTQSSRPTRINKVALKAERNGADYRSLPERSRYSSVLLHNPALRRMPGYVDVRHISPLLIGIYARFSVT